MISRGALEALLVNHLRGRGCAVASAADSRVPDSLECAEEFGALLANFHALTDDFVPPRGAAWTAPHRAALMGADPGWITRAYAHDQRAAAILVDWWVQASGVLGEHTGRPDQGMCHGEAFPATCRITDQGLLLAELGWAGAGDRTYDLATFRWVLALHAGADGERLFSRFLAGYGSVRPVPDLASLRAWVAARHLWSLRLVAGFAEPAGLARRAAFAASWPVEPRGEHRQ